MSWRITRLGRIYDPEVHGRALGTHASNPAARVLNHSMARIYFGCRDDRNRTRIAFVDVDIERLTDAPHVSEQPVLGPGAVGYYDDSGASMGCIIQASDSAWRIYYMGWNLGQTVPWRNSIGCAVERADGTYQPVSPAPVLDRNFYDPFSLSYPWVLRTDAGWQMWYGSHSATGPSTADMRHIIRIATSTDGLVWVPRPKPALGLSVGEVALARPSVIQANGRWHMWFCYRGAAYRIGYAWSANGEDWHRDDRLGGLNPLGEGWETHETCYPAVFTVRGQLYMLYNGDGYGRTGFGLARLDWV